MTIDGPRCFSVAVASARMPTSVVPPAGHGTMRVTGRTGKFCACAAPIHAANPAASAVAKILPFTAFSPFLFRCSCDRRVDDAARLSPITFCRNRAASLVSARQFNDSCPMTATPDTATARPSFADTLAVYLKPRVLIVLFLGFSAGLPLALSSSTLLVWMREVGVDLGVIGLFALVGTPYTIKFLWAPVVDALDVPILSPLLGRRRGWLVLSQLLLIVAIVLLAFSDPARAPWYVVFAAAVFVATASATQDIVIDAFRIESLPESQQAAGMAAYVAAYRIGMLASTAGALFLVSGFEGLDLGKGAAWTAGYLAMAALVVIGIATALSATEPEKSAAATTEHAA